MAAEKIDALELDITAQLSVENLDKLVDSLRKLGKEMDNIKNKNPKQSIKQTGDSANEAAKGFDNFLGKTVRVAAVIALFSKLTDTIGDCVSKSLTYQKTLNMFTVSLGEYADNATKYANAVNDALGIDIAGWQNAQGIFQTLITGFGVTGDKAAYMSQNLTQLTYDIASFYNLTNEEAANKIKSALSGRLEPIRKLGYDLSQSKLVDIAKNPKYYGQETFSINEQTGAIEQNTIATDENTQHKIVNFNQLTQQEKVQLRYIALMTEVTQVQGNYARALSDPANQMRIFKEQTEMTSRALGNVFIPAINAVLPYLTALAQLAEEAFNSLASLFGYDVSSITSRIGDATIAEPYNDIVKATGAAANNAKKIRDYTIGLDELNVLREPTTGAGGGGSAGGQQSNLSNLLTPGYDFLSKAIQSSVEQAKADLRLLQKDFKEHPLQVSWEIFSTGAGELGSGVWEAILGMTPDEFGLMVEKNGGDYGFEFAKAFFNKLADTKIAQVQMPLWEALFGDANALGARAAEAGRDVGDQFFMELTLAGLKAINNPVMKWFYNTVNKRDLDADIASIQKNITSKKNTATTPVGGYNYASSNMPLALPSGMTDAYQAAGAANSKAYADGFKSNYDYVKTETDKVFKAALNGVGNDGKGGQMFNNTAANEAYKFAMGISSPKAKSDAYNAGASLSYQGDKGARWWITDWINAGDSSGQGYVAGVNKNKKAATSSGETIGKAALKRLKEYLGIHSPSTEFGEAGLDSVLGYANWVKKYSYLASNATRDMADSALKAVETANSYGSTNAGYGIGMANQGAMATLASNIYNAVASGMANLVTDKGDTVVMIDGKEIYRVVRNEERKAGVAISNGTFA